MPLVSVVGSYGIWHILFSFTQAGTSLEWISVDLFYCNSFISHFKASVQPARCKELGFLYFHGGRVFSWTNRCSQLFITIVYHSIYLFFTWVHPHASLRPFIFATVNTATINIFISAPWYRGAGVLAGKLFRRGTTELCRTHAVSQSGVPPAGCRCPHNPASGYCGRLL